MTTDPKIRYTQTIPKIIRTTLRELTGISTTRVERALRVLENNYLIKMIFDYCYIVYLQPDVPDEKKEL